MRALTPLLASTVVTGVMAEAPGPMPEEQLVAKERIVQPKEGSTKAKWSQITQRLPYIAYYENFDEKFPKLKAAAEEARQTTAEDAAGADRPANAKETPGSKIAADAASTAFVGMGAIDMRKDAFIPGTRGYTASAAFLGAAIAFDVLSWLAKDSTDADVRFRTINELRRPSLYLLRIAKGTLSEEQMHEEVVAGQQQIAAFGLECEPALYHAELPTTRGYIMPGWMRSRKYVCGYAPGEDLGWFANNRAVREHWIYLTQYETTLFAIKFEKLDEMAHMPRLLGLDKSAMDTAARVMYQKIASALDPKWTVVFTAPGADGEWHAYAAREGFVVEYPPVPKR